MKKVGSLLHLPLFSWGEGLFIYFYSSHLQDRFISISGL